MNSKIKNLWNEIYAVIKTDTAIEVRDNENSTLFGWGVIPPGRNYDKIKKILKEKGFSFSKTATKWISPDNSITVEAFQMFHVPGGSPTSYIDKDKGIRDNNRNWGSIIPGAIDYYVEIETKSVDESKKSSNLRTKIREVIKSAIKESINDNTNDNQLLDETK
jgi:hypothetical protein